MRMQIGKIILTIAYAVVISTTYAQTNQTNLVLRILASECQYSKNSLSFNYSTGFILKESGRIVGIVTTLHGVCGCNKLTATDSNGKRYYNLKIAKADIDSDVALLTSNEISSNFTAGFEFSPISKSTLTGRDVIIYGYPYGREIILTQKSGKISEPSTGSLRQFVKSENIDPLSKRGSPKLNEEVLNLEAEIAPGQSGAPILYDGKVVGIGNGGLGGGTSVACWAIPVKNISFLPISSIDTDLSILKTYNPNKLFVLTCGLDETISGKEVSMSMLGSEIVTSTPDANTDSPDLIIKPYTLMFFTC